MIRRHRVGPIVGGFSVSLQDSNRMHYITRDHLTFAEAANEARVWMGLPMRGNGAPAALAMVAAI